HYWRCVNRIGYGPHFLPNSAVQHAERTAPWSAGPRREARPCCSLTLKASAKAQNDTLFLIELTYGAVATVRLALACSKPPACGPGNGQPPEQPAGAGQGPRVFDIPYMTQLAIGSTAWATLPDQQRQQVMQAFERYVTAVYAERFDKYAGERVEIIGEQPPTYGTMVKTQIVKAYGGGGTLNYFMVNGNGAQIGDVYLSGTISELAAKRADFSSTLRTQGVPGLIAALNNKALTLAPAFSGSSSAPR